MIAPNLVQIAGNVAVDQSGKSVGTFQGGQFIQQVPQLLAASVQGGAVTYNVLPTPTQFQNVQAVNIDGQETLFIPASSGNPTGYAGGQVLAGGGNQAMLLTPSGQLIRAQAPQGVQGVQGLQGVQGIQALQNGQLVQTLNLGGLQGMPINMGGNVLNLAGLQNAAFAMRPNSNMLQAVQVPQPVAQPIQQTIPVQVPVSTANGQTVMQTIQIPVQTVQPPVQQAFQISGLPGNYTIAQPSPSAAQGFAVAAAQPQFQSTNQVPGLASVDGSTVSIVPVSTANPSGTYTQTQTSVSENIVRTEGVVKAPQNTSTATTASNLSVMSQPNVVTINASASQLANSNSAASSLAAMFSIAQPAPTVVTSTATTQSSAPVTVASLPQNVVTASTSSAGLVSMQPTSNIASASAALQGVANAQTLQSQQGVQNFLTPQMLQALASIPGIQIAGQNNVIPQSPVVQTINVPNARSGGMQTVQIHGLPGLQGVQNLQGLQGLVSLQAPGTASSQAPQLLGGTVLQNVNVGSTSGIQSGTLLSSSPQVQTQVQQLSPHMQGIVGVGTQNQTTPQVVTKQELQLNGAQIVSTTGMFIF